MQIEFSSRIFIYMVYDTEFTTANALIVPLLLQIAIYTITCSLDHDPHK